MRTGRSFGLGWLLDSWPQRGNRLGRTHQSGGIARNGTRQNVRKRAIGGTKRGDLDIALDRFGHPRIHWDVTWGLVSPIQKRKMNIIIPWRKS
jgi:hypothetical protein